MSVKETLLQIIIAALSVIGCYGILHVLLETLLTPRELAAAIVLTRPLPPEELDILLCEAKRAPCGHGKRVVLVLPLDLWETCMQEDGEYRELTEKYGATLSVTCGSAAPTP